MGHDDPLGHPGAAGGVHDDGGVLRQEVNYHTCDMSEHLTTDHLLYIDGFLQVTNKTEAGKVEK